MSAQKRQQAKDLVELAVDERTPDKERVAAAFKACRIIRKYDLLASPLDGLLDSGDETVQAAGTILQAITDPTLVNSVKKITSRFKRSRRR